MNVDAVETPLAGGSLVEASGGGVRGLGGALAHEEKSSGGGGGRALQVCATSQMHNSCTPEAYRLNFSMYQSCGCRF